MKIAIILGTRPEIIKMQPIIHEIQKKGHELVFIHTGQHFDFGMSNIFMDELELPIPDYFLKVRSSSQGVQTGSIISRCERILQAERPEITLVEGDTNSALGASIASAKLALLIGHVEAGCRSFDKLMSEEINRVLISDIARLHFAPTKNCVKNLLREGIDTSEIFLTGHPIVDLIRKIRRKINTNTGIVDGSYALVTIHRRENITDIQRISSILNALSDLSRTIQVVFPCHPHTKSQIIKYKLGEYLHNLIVKEPVGYLQSLSLIKHAKFVLTDSGGIQQEAALLQIPCITLRDETEWIETTETGVNFLAGHITERIKETIRYVETNYDEILKRFRNTKNIFGRSGVSIRIIKQIEKIG
jgi:UDP-N-acetylglucosamine 2-epimerase